MNDESKQRNILGLRELTTKNPKITIIAVIIAVVLVGGGVAWLVGAFDGGPRVELKAAP